MTHHCPVCSTPLPWITARNYRAVAHDCPGWGVHHYNGGPDDPLTKGQVISKSLVTVGDLKQKLDEFPDDMPVYILKDKGWYEIINLYTDTDEGVTPESLVIRSEEPGCYNGMRCEEPSCPNHGKSLQKN